MTQRLLKVILPPTEKKLALQIAEQEENTIFWQETPIDEKLVINVLTEAENSERIMDRFERNYSSTPGFKLIVLPVEASIPRQKSQPTNNEQTEKKKAPPSRISREELYADIVDSTKLSNIYIVMVVLSTVVASVGLLQNNVAVIIGAMVIAPFLGPNVALALSSCLADKKLGIDALKTLVFGVCIVVILSVLFGYFFDTNINGAEIKARTHAGVQDIFLALVSGAAGVLAFTTGTSSALIGVMVAVALLPPLTVFGLLLGAGDYFNAFGALLYFFINIICINLAGVTTFYLQGVTPRSWWKADKAKKATRMAVLTWSLLLFFLFIVIKLTSMK